MAERLLKAIGDALILMMPWFYDTAPIKVSELQQLAVGSRQLAVKTG
jgi:hypothetical protein